MVSVLTKYLHRIAYSLGLRIMLIPRRIYHSFKASRIRNKEFSLFCNNCFGAQILHDLNIRFNSPCVNLAFDFRDYVEFLSNLEQYLKLDIENVSEPGTPYPVGRFAGTDTLVKFMHFNSFEDAVQQWNKRRDRIIWDNIFVVLEVPQLPAENDTAILKRFLALPYRKAIVTSPKQNNSLIPPEIIYEVPYFDNFFWGKALTWSGSFSLKRNTDYFDYVSFLNKINQVC